MKIYLDMDGVLCNFFGKVFKHFPELQSYKTIPEDLLWDSIKTIDNFWEDLEPFEGYKELFNYSKEHFESVYILSGYSKHDYERSIKGKHEWLSRYLPEIPKENIFLVSRKEKKDFADKDSLLVDDYEKNIKDFRKNSGLVIYHKSIEETLKELRSLKAS